MVTHQDSHDRLLERNHNSTFFVVLQHHIIIFFKKQPFSVRCLETWSHQFVHLIASCEIVAGYLVYFATIQQCWRLNKAIFTAELRYVLD